MTQESVVVDYLELDRSSFFDKVELPEEMIMERYDAMVDEANSKKEYRVAHILLLANDQEAQNKLLEAKNRIAAGEEFEDLAKEVSEDDSSKFAGGDLGFATADVYEDEFAQALLALGKGQVSDVVETRDGLHLIKLTDERQPEVASFAELKDSIIKSLQEEGAQSLYVEALETLRDEAFSTSDLEAPAKALGLTKKVSKTITRASNSGLAQYKAIVDAAFSEVVLYEASNSEVIEVEDGKAVVIHLNAHNESKVKDFAVVSAQIERQLKNTKARAALEEQLSELLVKANAGEAVSAEWVEKKEQGRDTQGVDSSILNKVFETAKGGFAVAQLAGGDKALVRVDGISYPESAEDTESATQKVFRGKAYNEYRAYQQFVNESATIERN
jgi:peptidyl-prolyl cis-trans isomerase D